MLELLNIKKTYDNGVVALGGVTLSAAKGVYGLLGPNGAGKSTLMRTIATLQAPDAGSIVFDGNDAFADPLAWKRTLGYMPQEFGIYKGVSALEMLQHFAALKGIVGRAAQREAAETMLMRVNLWDHRTRHVANYSGGMLRRFGLAQALLGAPRLVIVDEPTAGLDPDERNRIMDLLAEVSRSAVVILSTHFIEDIKDLCEKLAIIANGRVLLEATPEQVLASVSGRVWERTIDLAELEHWTTEHCVLSHRLVRGRRVLRVYAPTTPDALALPAQADIEDAYFLALRNASK